MAELDLPGFGRTIVSDQTASDFLKERKRLREARMKWIEENECPTAYSVTSKDAAGNDVTFNTPFQIGIRKYTDADAPVIRNGKIEASEIKIHNDPELEKHLLDGIDAIFSEANTGGQARPVILKVGDETQSFIVGGEDKSPYPEILEGEDYGTYYARVSDQIQRQAFALAGNSTGGPDTGNDSLRGSSGAGTPDVGPVHESGAGDCERGRGGLGGYAESVCARDPGSVYSPDSGSADPSEGHISHASGPDASAGDGDSTGSAE